MRRFPGNDPASNEYNAEDHRARIFGQHVAEYMRTLKEQDEEAYKRQFGIYIKNGVEADNIESMYADAHAAIRKNPTPKKEKPEKDKLKKEKSEEEKAKKPKRFNKRKLTLKERRERVRQKKAKILKDLQKELAVADE